MKNRRSKLHIDVSGYDGSQITVTKRTFEERFPLSHQRLSNKTLIPAVEDTRENMKKRGLTKFFIRYLVTTTTEAEAWLKHFEGWYRNDMMNHASELTDTEHGAILNYLIVDPMGVKPDDTSDAMLYIAEQIMQVAPATASSQSSSSSSCRCRHFHCRRYRYRRLPSPPPSTRQRLYWSGGAVLASPSG